MGSLKEIKSRISSVNSTMKITSAMKMVASAKLRKAQRNSEAFVPYQEKLGGILRSFLMAETSFVTPYAEQREVKRVAIVVVASNSSLCGAFNSNVFKALERKLAEYSALGRESIVLYPVGKKVLDYCKKKGYAVQDVALMPEPEYQFSVDMADAMMQQFIDAKVDKVEILYQHCKSSSVQQLRCDCVLPIDLNAVQEGAQSSVEYLVEPDKKTLIEELLPKVIRLKFYASFMDSYAAEQAARMIAMQVATDNANDLLQELTIQYNKSRQQAITNELLDIIGGSQA